MYVQLSPKGREIPMVGDEFSFHKAEVDGVSEFRLLTARTPSPQAWCIKGADEIC